jgi:signal peptidase I
VKKSILSSETALLDLSKEILKKHKSIRFQAKGWSMRPFIRDGDHITVSPVEDSSLKSGDVVLYISAGNKVIVHRIIKKYKREGKTTLLIKGDASLGIAEKVDVHMVYGKVTAIERKGRKKRLDTKPYQVIGLFLAVISPFSKWIYPTGSAAKRCVRSLLAVIVQKIQGLKLYSIVAKRLIKGDIHYQSASSQEAHSLSQLNNSSPGTEIEIHVGGLDEWIKRTKDTDYCFIAERKKRVIGGVTLTRFLESDYPYEGWWIFGLGVNWRYRGLGIGERLVEMAVESAVKHKASEIKLLVFEDTKRAIKLYKKLGFRQISIPALDKQLFQEAKKTLRRRIILAKNIKSG